MLHSPVRNCGELMHKPLTKVNWSSVVLSLVMDRVMDVPGGVDDHEVHSIDPELGWILLEALAYRWDELIIL